MANFAINQLRTKTSWACMAMHARTHTYRNIYTLDITSIIFLVVVLLFCVREAPLLYIVFLYVRNVMKTTHVLHLC